MDIKIKYFDKNIPRITKIEKGDWIDLRVNKICRCLNDKLQIKTAIKNRNTDSWYDDDELLHYSQGDVLVMRLGVAMELPKRNEAELKPRSSTFADYGLLLTNSVGCIDESYCGNNDEWIAVYYATRDGQISRFDRVCQFRVNDKMPEINFIEVESLENKDRDGFGSTGVK
jgi:dUTP pyrophosphatase